MPSGLPEFLDLAQVMRQPAERAGRVRISDMPRLCAALYGNTGEAVFEIRAREEAGRVVLDGSVHAELNLLCQRCLEPMQRPVTTQFRLTWVRDETEAVALASGQSEPLLSMDGRVRLAELIEDELLLALPIVSVHEQAECSLTTAPTGARQVEAEPVKQNPFAVLKQLKPRH